MSSVSENHGSRTILWGVPRSVSTALMKCLSFIEENEVWCEPYLYCYCAREEYRRATNADMPMAMEYEGNEEVFQIAKEYLENVLHTKFEPDRISYGSIKSRLENTSSKYVFVKDFACSVTMVNDALQYLPVGYKHSFLIRNPLRTIYSYRKNMITLLQLAGLLGSESRQDSYDVERDDWYFSQGCFVKELYNHWVYVKENIDSNPVVIDADDLLTKPKETLSAYCAAVGLPYSDRLLQWDASTDVAKKIKAPGDNLLIDNVSFKKAMGSSEFMPPSKLPPRDQMTPDVIRCSEKAMTYYEEMYEQRLKV